MYIKLKLISALLPFVFSSLLSGYSQISLKTCFDAGKNVILSDYYVSNSILTKYTLHKYSLSSGFSNIYNGQKGFHFEGFFIKGSRKINLFRRTVEVDLFYLHKPLSDIIKENNWGIYTEYTGKRFEIILGCHFRKYRLNADNNLPDLPEITSYSIHENWNIIYSFQYRIFTTTSWQLSGSVTNMDYFIIEQETNPLFNIKMSYKIRNKVMPYIAYWHRSAGMFNLKANHFGYHFRLGLEWEL